MVSIGVTCDCWSGLIGLFALVIMCDGTSQRWYIGGDKNIKKIYIYIIFYYI